MIPLLLGLLLAGAGAQEDEPALLQPSPRAEGRIPAAANPLPAGQEEEPRALEPGPGALEGRVTVVFWPEHEARARRILEVLEARPDLPALPPGLPSSATVFVARDLETFHSLTGGRVPSWGAGVAIPARRRIVLPGSGVPWAGRWPEERLIRHEWAHLGLHEYLSGLRVPRWFDEGYAQWSSGGMDMAEAWRLRILLVRGRAPPLDSLAHAWPRDRASAELAYLLSATVLDYMTRQAGARGLALFLERWRETGSFENALRRTYGITSAELEDRWLDHVSSRYGWLLVLSQSVVFWGIAGTGLLVLFWIRRRRDRERMAELRATDPPDHPAWWSGEPRSPIGGAGGAGEPSSRDDVHRPP